MNAKYFIVKTTEGGELLVNTIDQAVSCFMGWFKEFTAGMDDCDAQIACMALSSYLLATGKIVPVK